METLFQIFKFMIKQKKTLASSYNSSFIFLWTFDSFSRRLCHSSFHLCTFLMTKILGISAFYHDSASCIINEGEIIAAAQEERFSRIKHDQNFPRNAIKFCLKKKKRIFH